VFFPTFLGPCRKLGHFRRQEDLAVAEPTPPTPDPLALWREWVSQSERQWNTFLNEMMGTDQFSQSMGRFMEIYLAMQKNMTESMGRYFTALNIPTRTDVLTLADRLAAIEDRLARIEGGLGRLGDPRREAGGLQVPAPSPPPRTRKPAAPGAEGQAPSGGRQP
jgi:hypothetical protein